MKIPSKLQQIKLHYLCNFDYLTLGKLQNYFTHIMRLLVRNPYYWKFLTRQIWMLATVEKSKWTGCFLVTKSCLFCHPMDYSPPLTTVTGFSRQEYGVGCHSFLQGDLPDPGNEPRSPTLQVKSLPRAAWEAWTHCVTLKTLPLPPISRISIEWQNIIQGAGSYIIS